MGGGFLVVGGLVGVGLLVLLARKGWPAKSVWNGLGVGMMVVDLVVWF